MILMNCLFQIVKVYVYKEKIKTRPASNGAGLVTFSIKENETPPFSWGRLILTT